MSVPMFADSSLIDPDQFDMLVEAGDSEAAEMLTELLDLFTEESGDNVSELLEKLQAGDEARCIRLAHALAGAAGNLGLMRLSVAARYLENNFNSHSAEERLALGQCIQALYNESIAEYRSKIAAL